MLTIGMLTQVMDDDVPSRPLTIATSVRLGHEPFYLALELGAWNEQQVRLIECSSAAVLQSGGPTG